MALKKNKETDFGISADYWKITQLSFKKDQGNICFVISLFINNTANKPLETLTIEFSIMDEPLDQDWRALCYSKIKTLLEFFKDATDI